MDKFIQIYAENLLLKYLELSVVRFFPNDIAVRYLRQIVEVGPAEAIYDFIYDHQHLHATGSAEIHLAYIVIEIRPGHGGEIGFDTRLEDRLFIWNLRIRCTSISQLGKLLY